MTAKEVIEGRRSIRKFKDTPVPHEVLEAIVDEAKMAPSWKNTQIARYIVAEGDTVKKLAECTKAYSGNGTVIAGAPAVVGLAVKKGRCGYERDGSFTTFRGDGWQMFDAGVAAQTFCLAAYEHGIGSVIMGIFDHEDASRVLNIPEDMDLVSLIPIGYPDGEAIAPKRKTVEELLSYV
ncbi:MAG: nitroreductase family protein [Lachnospiraceae bacterium]|nr:nitroreductase family protein [Lachnospiraceae bacterium]